jgi:hypothetical protein
VVRALVASTKMPQQAAQLTQLFDDRFMLPFKNKFWQRMS